MKKILCAAGLLSTLLLAPLAQAHVVTFTTKLKSYNGYPAYLAMYLTDANGRYKATLWVAGSDSDYYGYLRGWARGSRLRSSAYDGLTGASVTSGRSLQVRLNLSDQFINHGYKVVIDSAVEGMGSNRNDVVVPLSTADSGRTVSGRGYIRSFTYQL